MIDLTLLDPDFSKKAIAWQAKCEEEGQRVRMTIGARTPAEQQKAFDTGASHALPNNDPHTVLNADGDPASLALDFACYDENWVYITDGTNPAYRRAGETAKSLGLHYGGDWHRPDWDHIEDARWIWHPNDTTVHAPIST